MFDNELSHSMVHYLLSIHKLKEEKGYARVTDIAKSLKITKGSVSTAINNLKKKNLVVEEEDSKFLDLSEKGHQQVHEVLTSRTLLYYFLKDFLGVSEEVAHRDSCMMEHLVGPETRDKFFSFMKSLSSDDYKATTIKSSLDLSKYNSPEEFLNDQKGDSHLSV